MKIIRALSFLSLFGMYACGVPVLAADSSVFTGPVFSQLCQSGVQQITAGTWALNRPQLAIAEDGLYFSQRHFGQGNEWSVNFTTDGVSTKTLLAGNVQIRDMLVSGGQLWVLFNDQVQVLDRHSGSILGQIKMVNGSLQEPVHERAHEMTAVNGKLYISQGSLGLVVIDMASQKLEKIYDLNLRSQKEGHWSKAVGVASVNGKLYITVDGVTMDTSSSKAFNGLIVADIKNPNAFKNFAINRKDSGVITQMMSSQIQNDSLVMNNWGFFQVLPLSSLQASASEFSTQFKETRTNVNGTTYSVELMGDMAFSGNQFYACGKISPDDAVNQIPKREGLVYQGDL